MDRLMLEVHAIREARGKGIPIALPPLPNGVVVVVSADSAQHNFVNATAAAAFMVAASNEMLVYWNRTFLALL